METTQKKEKSWKREKDPIEYVRISWPDYQELMEHPDWIDQAQAIGNSDQLIPKIWIS